jgi:hypothetical protein
MNYAHVLFCLGQRCKEYERLLAVLAHVYSLGAGALEQKVLKAIHGMVYIVCGKFFCSKTGLLVGRRLDPPPREPIASPSSASITRVNHPRQSPIHSNPSSTNDVAEGNQTCLEAAMSLSQNEEREQHKDAYTPPSPADRQKHVACVLVCLCACVLVCLCACCLLLVACCLLRVCFCVLPSVCAHGCSRRPQHAARGPTSFTRSLAGWLHQRHSDHLVADHANVQSEPECRPCAHTQ